MQKDNIEFKKGFDFIGVTVTFLCHDGKGNFVLAKRGANARDENGKWDTGGGALEFNDTVEQTLKQEIAQEYCTDVIDFEFLGYRDVHRENQGRKTHWIALDFKVLVNPDKVKIGEPHKFDDIGWFTLDNMPENLHSQLPIALRLYNNKLRT